MRVAAATTLSGRPTNAPISIEIWYFYSEDQIDLDNIAKPICDALKKLVYEDDRQIIDLHLRKIGLAAKFDASKMAALLAGAIQSGRAFIDVCPRPLSCGRG